MKKDFFMIILLFFLCMSRVSAKIVFDDYHVEVSVNENKFKVEERFNVASNDLYETPYALYFFDVDKDSIETNVEDYNIYDEHIVFFLNSNKEYYINYEVITNDFIDGGIDADSYSDISQTVIEYDKFSILIKFKSIEEMKKYAILENGQDFKKYTKEGNTISWEYKNITNNINNHTFASFGIRVKQDVTSIAEKNKIWNILIMYLIIPSLIVLCINMVVHKKYSKNVSKKVFIGLAIITGINYILL